MKNKYLNRILSSILCVAIVLSMFPAVPFSVTAAGSSSGTETVVTTDVETREGINYEITRTTRYIGNRTYCVQVDISANLSTYDQARIRTAAQNGYITVEEDGWYLIEMWGGKGGNGQGAFTVVVIIPVYNEGGRGGNGGYVYGKVYLKAGQTLVYNIGTDGGESVVRNDDGGGVNGDGGTHGDDGSLTVGGGGGYTAIYLFEEGEFQESYVTETSINIPENARVSRVLMIAGGGGGGGAAFLDAVLNGSATGAANGGMGGNINNGISMSLLGSDYTVPGYVFSGRNGQSSGTSTEYIGRGGSNVPGAVSSTLFDQFEPSSLPNDWSGTYNTAALPGAGGAGNFRGGGGGSGYAGGSGGIMQAQLIAANVGGGGGGSSFVAAEVNGEPIEFLTLTEKERNYLSGASNQPEGDGPGGAVQITFLGGVEDDFEALQNVTITGSVTKYFDILSSSKVSSGGTLITTAGTNDTTFTASGLTIVPVSPAHGGTSASVTLYIRAKDDFMGGNSVPLMNYVQADFLSPKDNTTPITLTPSESKAHSYVNVPLNAKMRTRSYTSSQDGKAYSESALYYDDYSAHRSALSDYPDYYSYISEISEYAVYEYDQNTGEWAADSNSTVSPSATTTYQVRYTVTPKTSADPEVTVGPAVENPTTVIGTAVISVVEPGIAELNGLLVTGTKNLTYGNGTYTFSTIIDLQSDVLEVNTGTTSISTVGNDQQWPVSISGWYYIQVWGGNGGSGGSAAAHQYWCNTWCADTTTRSNGGTGGYVGKYVYLEAGQVLTYSVGAVGTNGTSRSSELTSSAANRNNWCSASGDGGGAGGASSISLDGVLIASAGGGGGGAGSIAYVNGGGNAGIDSKQRQGAAGESVTSTVTSISSIIVAAAGTSGYYTTGTNWAGYRTVATFAGTRGTAGNNFSNADFGTTQNGYTISLSSIEIAQGLTTSKSVTSGQFAITLLESDEMLEKMESVYGLSTEVAFARYFDIASDSVSLKTAQTCTQTRTENADGSYTVVYTNTTVGEVARFTYAITPAGDGISTVIRIWDCIYAPKAVVSADKKSLYYSSNLQFDYTLTPKEGFLGGNDVPVLVYGQTGGVADKDTLPDCGVRISQGEDFMNLPAADPTDFANVEATVDLSQYLTVQDKTIHLGDSVQKSELYTFTPPTYGADAWEDDYATFVAPSDETYTPTQTTEYPITTGFAPRVETAQKATIVGSLGPQEYTLYSTVYVEVPVTTNLINLTCDNPDWTLWGESFGCTVTPKAGYILPQSIAVTVGGVETSNFTYDSVTGTVSIDGQYVTGPIVISGAADVKTYKIHIVYTNYDPTTGMDVEQPEVLISGIEADSVIDWSQYNAIKDAHNAKPGYEYRWVFETDDGEQPTTMPAKDLWVYGSYVKGAYPLTIYYVDKDGNSMPGVETYEGYAVFGDTYTVASPTVKGYIPNQTVVTGTMDEDGVEVTVTYEPSSNMLIILYQKEDGTLLGQETVPTVTGGTYTVESPNYVGYETDTTSVTVTMDGEETQTVIVVYKAKKFTVTFDYTSGGFDSASLDGEDSKLVEYDNIYGYNAKTGLYDGLPTAQFAGYTFVGWYADAACTVPVTESDTVTIEADATLYAKWELTEYKLTVQYVFYYESGDYIPEGYNTADAVQSSLVKYEEMVAFGETYSVDLPDLVGYSAYEDFGLNSETKQEICSGTMPGQNKLVVITYKINVYTVIFKDLPGSYVTYSDGETSTVATDSFNTVWGSVNVKHAVSPDYNDVENPVTPNHATREEYTYEFTGWYGFAEGELSPTFPAATEDCEYYAAYYATENIVTVTLSSTTRYFTNIADALAFAENNVASYAVTMKFRRNSGNIREIELKDDRLVIGNTFTGTTGNGIVLNLNGLLLKDTVGQTAIENNLKAIPLTITDTGAGGRIQVTGDGDVIAIESTTGNITVSSSVRVEAISNAGNATGIRFGAGTLNLNAALSIEATAGAGTAVGIDLVGNATVTGTALEAAGADAIGIRVQDGATLTLSGSNLAMTVAGTDSATGVHVAQGATFADNATNTNQQRVEATGGDAYGINNAGTVSSLNLKMLVEAAQNAYGLYNNAGTVTVGGIKADTDFRANGGNGANGYGLFNVENGTTIGSADGDKLHTGAFAGSSYGIYSDDGSIYASGNFVYFKGGIANLSGVEHEGYDEVAADDQFEAGYFRLAALRTIIIYETKGGTVIAQFTQHYDTLLDPVTATRSGYTFVEWLRAEDDSVFAYPERMLDEDLAVYADWSLNTYYYSLDKEFKNLTINFYKTTTATTPLQTVYLTKDNQEFTPPADQSYTDTSRYLYIHSGWYTSDGEYVPMHGDISSYADENGVLNLYAKFNKSSSSSSYKLYSTTSYKKLTTDPNPSQVYISSSYSGSSYMYYMYYVVEVDGNYTFNIQNHGSYNKQYYIFTYKPTNTSGYNSVAGYYTLDANTTTTYTFSNLEKGQVIVIGFRRGSSSSSSAGTYVSCYVSTTADLTGLDENPCSSEQELPIEYNVEMGTVALPVADSTEHEGMKFAGWAENETSERIMEITPEMVDTVDQWKNDPTQLWQLYSQWTERTWDAYQSAIRDFTAFEGTAQVTVRGNGTVSVRFKSEQTPTEALSFRFANGLPAGSILTLIDRSGAVPAYYTYTTETDTTELSSTAFVKMGEATTAFDGVAADVVLQICYQNAPAAAGTETVSIFAGDIVSEVDVAYEVAQYISLGLPDQDSTQFAYTETHDYEISGISLDGVDLPQNYRVFMRVRWDGLNLAPGTAISFSGMTATVYGGEYAVFDTGFTVEQMTGTISGVISIELPTMVQNEFQDKAFYYELCIAPDLQNAFGEDVWTLLSICDILTLEETPSLSVGSVDIETVVGEEVSVTVSSPDAEIYLCQQSANGVFQYSANCATVFETLAIDANGKLSIADGTLINDGAFTATVSADAVLGKYYLVVKLGDKYERILLKLVAATS